MPDFEALIIGSGMAGIPAMRTAALTLGKKTAAVIGKEFGGTCLNFGCIPKKALYHVADMYEQAGDLSKFGITIQGKSLNFKDAMKFKRSVINRLGGLRKESVSEWGVALFEGDAKFVSPNEIELENGKRLTAEKFFIATGGDPIRPPIPGIEHAITSKEVLSLDELPESMVIIGSGYIGMEFASIYSAFGTKITVLELGENLMPNLSRDASNTVQNYLQSKGVVFYAGAETQNIKLTNGKKNIFFKTPDGEKTVETEQVLVAIGRKPNLNILGLDNAGIEINERGFIKTNDYYQTANPNVYAIGDVIGEPQLTSKANYDGNLAVINAFSKNGLTRDYSVVVFAEYTMPICASVGVTETGKDVGFMKVPYDRLPSGNATGKTEGYIKIFVNQRTDEIVGGEIVGTDADELINSLAFAVKTKMTKKQVNEILVFHPSLAEGIKFATRGEVIGHQDEEDCCG